MTLLYGRPVPLHDRGCHDLQYSVRLGVLRIGQGAVEPPVSICALYLFVHLAGEGVAEESEILLVTYNSLTECFSRMSALRASRHDTRTHSNRRMTMIG